MFEFLKRNKKQTNVVNEAVEEKTIEDFLKEREYRMEHPPGQRKTYLKR